MGHNRDGGDEVGKTTGGGGYKKRTQRTSSTSRPLAVRKSVHPGSKKGN